MHFRICNAFKIAWVDIVVVNAVIKIVFVSAVKMQYNIANSSSFRLHLKINPLNFVVDEFVEDFLLKSATINRIETFNLLEYFWSENKTYGIRREVSRTSRFNFIFERWPPIK